MNVQATQPTAVGAGTSFRILHTMIRVLDLEKSIDFYTRLLGMNLLRRKDYPAANSLWRSSATATRSPRR